METRVGRCHCGRVSFAFDGPITHALVCNCSICSMKGAIWHAVAPEQFRITAGQSELATYTFGTHVARHHFCSHCGVSVFSNPRIAPRMWAVNLRCVEDVALDSLPQVKFDGRDWERAAAALLAARRTPDEG